LAYFSSQCRYQVSGNASWKLAAASVLLLAGLADQAAAIERHPAPEPTQPSASTLPGMQELGGSDDATPLGVTIGGIVVDDRLDDLPNGDVSGVQISTGNETINDPQLKSVLDGFIGQPLSFKLIDDVRAAVVTHMRDHNRPLVAVIVPPQEVTGGTLRIAVLPFVVGEKKVERLGSRFQRGSDERILASVRVQPGEEVDSGELLEDLNWLNRSPFRKVGVVFDKGRLAGETDITLTLKDERPWQAYAGYANSGTRASGHDRVYSGFAAELPWDALVSYQYVTSPETIYSDGRFHNLNGDKAYMSHGFSYVQAYDNRMQLSLDGNYIHSRSRQNSFLVQDSRLLETGARISIPFSPLGPASEIFVGAEAKWQSREREFAGTPLGQSHVEIYQVTGGVRSEAQLNGHQIRYGLSGVFSPGGLGSNNTDAAFRAFSANNRAKARYAYLEAWADASLNLPHGLRLNLSGEGQVASGALPETERFDIGGVGTVRGYATGELSGDHGFWTQSELHLPPASFGELLVDFYGFLDHGKVYDFSVGGWSGITSIGLGAEVRMTDRVSLKTSWGYSLSAGPITTKQSNRLHIAMTATY